MNKVQFLKVSDDRAGQRLDNFLFVIYKNVPKSRVYRAIRQGEVRINKKRCKGPEHLKAGDELRLPPLYEEKKAPSPKPSLSLTTLLKQRILYEDSQLIVLNKPSGLAVHGGSGIRLGIIEAVKNLYPHSESFELVHRLDRDTSGCLLIAKKRSMLRELQALFRSHQIKKIYYCLCQGAWDKSIHSVEAPLARFSLASGEHRVAVNAQGKDSKTSFKILKSFKNATLMKAELETGRMHQIRVHAASVKRPLAGDEKYGDPLFNKIMQEKGLKRLFLHAYRLEFIMPTNHEKFSIEAPLDEDLQEILKTL